MGASSSNDAAEINALYAQSGLTIVAGLAFVLFFLIAPPPNGRRDALFYFGALVGIVWASSGAAGVYAAYLTSRRLPRAS